MAESTIFEDKKDSGLVLDVKNPKDQNYLIFRQIDMDKSKILEHLFLLLIKQRLKSEYYFLHLHI